MPSEQDRQRADERRLAREAEVARQREATASPLKVSPTRHSGVDRD